MDWLRVQISRIAGLFSQRRLDAELEEELRSHIDMAVEEHRRRGLSEQEARTQALREFGGVTQTRERYRDQRGFPFLESLWRDIRHGQRQLRKSPGFTIAVVCTLALGIGANLAVFLVLYGVVLRPLPFPHADRLVQIDQTLYGSASPVLTGTEALFFGRGCKACASSAAYDFEPTKMNLVQRNGVVPLAVRHVTPGFFHVFEMEPVIGTGFPVADKGRDASETVVLSNALWRNQFGANPHIIGKAVTLGSRIYTVVGVANPDFRLRDRVDAWVPLLITEHANDRGHRYLSVLRLKPGVTVPQASRDLQQVLREYRKAYPNTWASGLRSVPGIKAAGLHKVLIGGLSRPLEMLMGAVLLVLIIVAANLLGLLMTRAVARRQDMSVRTALGASGWRLLRQLLVENMLLCVLGGAVGVAAAWLLTPILMRLSPLRLPAFASFGMGRSALLFAGSLVVICTLIFSVVPALETRRSRLSESLRLNSARIAVGRHIIQRALVVSQVAVSLVLLVAAAVLLTTFWKLENISPGFSATNVLTFKSIFTDTQEATSPLLAQRIRELNTRIAALPGVQSVAEALMVPMQGYPFHFPFHITGRAGGNSSGGGVYLSVTSHYFSTLEIPMIKGRAFSTADTAGTLPVVIVNKRFAQTFFKGVNPIGQHILIGAGMPARFKDQVREIVGVVGNVREQGLQSAAPPMMYLPVRKFRMVSRIFSTSC